MIGDHQDLLNRYYLADRQWIYDRSGAIREDMEQLFDDVTDYVRRNLHEHLNIPPEMKDDQERYEAQDKYA